MPGSNSEGKDTGTQINSLEQKEEINIQPEQNEETRIQKMEERLRNLWDNIKHSNIRIIGVLKEEEQEDIENLLEQIMKENFPNLAKETDFQEVQEAQRVPKKLDPKRNAPRYIIIKLLRTEVKERILEAVRGKESCLQGSAHGTGQLISKEILQARKGWKKVFEVMKGKDLHPRLLCPMKLSFGTEEQIKHFPDNVKLKEFIITKPLLYEMSKGLI